jgi:hypothetical protein
MASRKGDPAFATAGKKPGIEIWRVEKMKIATWDPADYGKFHSGDCYIVLHTKRTSTSWEWDLYYWLGAESSQDEQGVVAYKTVELDEDLGGTPVQHREVQGHESAPFLALFKSGIQYLAGGVESGFKHVTPDNYKPRLLHVKGKRNCRVSEVPMVRASLNDGDVFILDMGLKMFQWNGKTANKYEKVKGLEMMKRIRDDERGGRPEIFFLDSKSPDVAEAAPFWKAIGGKGAIKSEEEGGSDEEVKMEPLRLFRVSDSTGKMTLTPVAEGKLAHAMLDPHDVFILDHTSEIFVWVGKQATKEERTKSMIFATSFLKEGSRPSHTPVTRVIQGGETTLFKGLFTDWPVPKVSIKGARAAFEEKKGADVSGLYGKGTREEQKMFDDGTGRKDIWRIENFAKVPVPTAQYGQFFQGDSYIVLYTYINASRKEKHIIYFWQGYDSSADEKGASALLTVAMDTAMDGEPVQVRVPQGREPDHFLSLFKGKFIVHSGGHAAAWKNKKDTDSYDTDGISLYHIKGTSPLNTKAVQVPERAASLNSGDCFVLLTPGAMFVWMGKGSNKEERDVALQVADTLKQHRTITQCHEGSEDSNFWAALGGKGPYPTSKEMAAEPRDPRLFHCSNMMGYFKITEIMDFQQEDLINDDVMILDTFSEVYIWCGALARPEEKKEAFKAALDFVKNSPDGRSPDTPVYRIEAGNEPPIFTCHFQGWNYAKATDFEDPYTKQLRIMKGGAVGEAKGDLTRVSADDVTGGPKVFFSYEDLVNKHVPKDVDLSVRELYLSEAEFQEVFKVSKADFALMPKWKQQSEKKKHKLF